jgi:tryptophanyl-tRNA synthetase
MSLRDGTKKMSKSDASEFSRLNLTDGADAIADKIRKAKTDPHPLPDAVEGLAGRPEAENLLGIYAALTDKTLEATVAEFAGAQFSTFKGALSDVAVAVLGPIGAEMKRLMDDPGYVDGVLRRGAEKAGTMAARHLREVQDLVGFLRP